ncbi:DNA (cytosine-5)-methyltransferase DRM2 [Euphorbia peplus]|nr:DNA (cytosine-5)-methyltransferase DRM2 [Euphorbia peplus]
MAAISDDEFNWNSDDDREIDDSPVSFKPPSAESMEASSSGSGLGSKMIDDFIRMGFSEKMICEAIQANNGEENTSLILDTLLAYTAIEESTDEAQPHVEPDQCAPSFSSESDYGTNFSDNSSDSDSDENEVIVQLAQMGYSEEETSIALERCGPNASIAELTDFISAAQMAETMDVPEQKPMKRLMDDGYCSNKQKKKLKIVHEEDEEDKMVGLPNPMIGFGLPSDSWIQTSRDLPKAARGPPYFYYENVACAPKGVWQTISSYLYEVTPEFVDSKYFCAAARKRGYIHNLPINNRFLLPPPPQTIKEALPLSSRWWPKWDPRTKLNCLQTVIGSAQTTEKIRKLVGDCEGDPPLKVQKEVLYQCRKWNFVWVGKNKVAPLEPDEVEMLLGFPKNHTRGGGISRTDRYKSLGNSFQVDTVAYHLSVLKDMFPGGINMLSLFSGIGGAEVALHRLGIKLKNVVSVEKSEVNRNIVRSWWEQTNQTGNLIDMDDVQDLQEGKIEQFIRSFGGFDLIVGGSPCNNLAGSNRLHRDGLKGKESSLFFDYWRILEAVKRLMARDN